MADTSSGTVPELVRDTGLITTFRNNNTITTHYKRWNRSKREYWRRTQQLIGTGGYSVWLETEIDHLGKAKDSRLRAVKEISCLSTQRDVFQDYIRELEAIAKFSQEKYSEYFVKSLGWYQSPGSLCIAMEYCPHGDLKHYLQQNGALAETDTQLVISQVLRGLVYMHEEGFAHRDLKPANILIVSQPPNEWTVKLSDFGLSKRTQESESTTVKGTMAYLPPELLDDGARRTDHFAGDVWCVGETTYELLTASTAFSTPTSRMRYASNRNLFPSTELNNMGISQEALNFVTSTMAPCPSNRPSPIEALDYAWFPQRDDRDDSPDLSDVSINAPYTLHPQTAVLGTDEWTTKDMLLDIAEDANEPQPLMSLKSADTMESYALKVPGINTGLLTHLSCGIGSLPRDQQEPSINGISHPQGAASSSTLEQNAEDPCLMSTNQAFVTTKTTNSPKQPLKNSEMAPYQARCSSEEDEEVATSSSNEPQLEKPVIWNSTTSEDEDSDKAMSPKSSTKQSRVSRQTGSTPRSGRDANAGSPSKKKAEPESYKERSSEKACLLEDRQIDPLPTAEASYEPTIAIGEGHILNRRASEHDSLGEGSSHSSSPEGSDKLQTSYLKAAPILSDLAVSLKPNHLKRADWLTMVALAEQHYPIYMGTTALPDLHELENASYFDSKVSTDDPQCISFLEMLRAPAFRTLWPADRNKDIFRDSCLLLLLSLIRRWRLINDSDSDASALPYLPTYVMHPGSWHKIRVYCRRSCEMNLGMGIFICHSCQFSFCGAHREEWKHDCTRAGASFRDRLNDEAADFTSPLPDYERPPLTFGLAPGRRAQKVTVPNDWCPAGLKIVTLVDVGHTGHRTLLNQRSSFNIFRVVGEDGCKLYLGRYPNGRGTDHGSPYINFESDLVSRNHAEIRLDSDGQWWLRDVGSSSGTYLNHVKLSRPNEQVKTYRLEDGDTIQLGGVDPDNQHLRTLLHVVKMRFQVSVARSTGGTSSSSSSSNYSTTAQAGVLSKLTPRPVR